MVSDGFRWLEEVPLVNLINSSNNFETSLEQFETTWNLFFLF
jgi:hypothetical protein